MSFHEVRFPVEISRGATGGPDRRTDVVVLGSGYEERNSRWAHARRTYNAGYGIKSLDDLHAVIQFFEERRGRLYGFRWRDHTDWKSGPPEQPITALDQLIGIGDGERSLFQLVKTYGSEFAPLAREIRKPVTGSILVAVDGALKTTGEDYTADVTTGSIGFLPGHIPPPGAQVTAGFHFDVPVRFDTDKLEINLQGFRHGAIPNIPIIEVRL
jgi:uncharacterized protein (TIGR02217 family)